MPNKQRKRGARLDIILRRVYSAVFGSGLGHITRVFAIAKILEKYSDCQFRYSAFDEAFDFLKKYEQDVLYAPSVAVRWNVAGGFEGRSTIFGFPNTSAAFLAQVSFERQKISSYNPQVIISDSRLSAVLAGKSLLYPVVTILNQIRLLFPPRFRKGMFSAILERVEADFLGLFWSVSDEVLIPDLPPPFTISEANVSHVDIANKIYFTGFMMPKNSVSQEKVAKARSALQIDSRPVIFIQISGPNATKGAFIRAALESASALAGKYNVVISKGLPSESTVPTRLANGAWVYGWCPIKDELFAMSDLLVARAGHTTISQCINAGKPSVLVPIFNHSEQIWNAEKSARLGLGVEIRSEYLTAKTLVSAVNQCLNDSSYSNNVKKLKLISDKFDGIQEAANIVKGFL
jgi:UDP-N-acetylglucosamine--N-acetylmuramyl-(pentapeptide) pyrophosphoryl-undecaprenol N-acetylglucosamine transferase